MDFVIELECKDRKVQGSKPPKVFYEEQNSGTDVAVVQCRASVSAVRESVAMKHRNKKSGGFPPRLRPKATPICIILVVDLSDLLVAGQPPGNPTLIRGRNC